MPRTPQFNDFKSGWIPTDDPINGRKNGCHEFNNLELDKNGAISLSGGSEVVRSGYGSNAHTLYSRVVKGSRRDYCAHADGNITRDGSNLASGGDGSNAGFSTAFNFTLICSGSKLLKDNIDNLYNLGIVAPGAGFTISVSNSNSPYKTIGSVSSGWVNPLGSCSYIGSPGYLQFTLDASTGEAAIQTYPGSSHNATQLTGPGGTGFATDDDFVIINGYTPDPSGVSLQFDVLLVNPGAGGDVVSDYYTYTVDDIASLNFSPLTGVFTIKIRRSEFQRIGGGVQDWSSVYGFRITLVGQPSAVINLWSYAYTGAFIIQGSTIAQFGTYEYVQVNVNNTGSYIAKSVIGPIVGPITIDGTCASITPRNPTTDDAQCNEAWIFRRSAGGNGKLDQWYRVLVFTSPWSAAYDIYGDQLALNAGITINLNLASVTQLLSGSDKVYDIIGPLEGRWYYFTGNFMYPSDINDPDLIDTSLGIRLSNSNGEKFMWARQVSDSIILVGTSVDVYVLTGTFQTLADSSIDIYFKPIGCKFPPITYDAAAHGGNVYYLAADGWRSINYYGNNLYSPFGSQENQWGFNPLLVSPTLDRLYRGDTCFNYAPPDLKTLGKAPGSVRYPIVVAKNKLFCFMTNVARVEVYDFVRQYWRVFNLGLGNANCATLTPDGQILVFHGDDKKLRHIDIRSSLLIDGTTKQSIALRTPIFDGGFPKQRKDYYTLRVRCATGGDNITVYLIDENNISYNLGTVSENGSIPLDHALDVSQLLARGVTWQVYITGQVSDFTLEDITFEFDERPIQLSYLHILPNNFNTTARKRVFEQPLQIDTMGHNVILTPYVDAAAKTPMTLCSAYKQSFTYKFDPQPGGGDVITGIDYEWTLKADPETGLFEFFGMEEPKFIELFPEQVSNFTIPTTNFGNACKKRLRVWPFILSAPNTTNITFYPIVDGAPLVGQTSEWKILSKQTVRHFFTQDIFGVDYSGWFTGDGPFEVWQILPPDIVQILPIARRFDQVGPTELFKYGRVKQLELRVYPNTGTKGTVSSLPVKLYFNDNTLFNQPIDIDNLQEKSYFINTAKGVSGQIVRVELGPTEYDFHRYYIRLQVFRTGKDTEHEWILLPEPQINEQQSG